VKYLLDTHAIIWCIDKRNGKFSTTAEEIIIDHQNIIYISSASLWEIAIKIGLGKLDLSFEILLRELENVGFIVLHTEPTYLRELINMPQIHKDPFDRLLIATAKVEQMTLVTADENIHKYEIPWVW